MQLKNKFQLLFSSVSLALLASCFLTGCGERSKEPAPSTEVKAQSLTTPITISPEFESQRGWYGDGYTRAMGHGKGAVVGPGSDNPNVFYQQFPAKPGEQYKIVARASTVDGLTAAGRLQINWIGPDDKFISASIKVIEVTDEEKTFETDVIAPASVTGGLLYVTPHGPKDVVRFTEMKVLVK